MSPSKGGTGLRELSLPSPLAEEDKRSRERRDSRGYAANPDSQGLNPGVLHPDDRDVKNPGLPGLCNQAWSS